MFGLNEDSFMQRKIFSLLGGKKFKKRIFVKIKENPELFNAGDEYKEDNSKELGKIIFDMIPYLLKKSTSADRLAKILLNNYSIIGLDKTIRKAKA